MPLLGPHVQTVGALGVQLWEFRPSRAQPSPADNGVRAPQVLVSGPRHAGGRSLMSNRLRDALAPEHLEISFFFPFWGISSVATVLCYLRHVCPVTFKA